MKKIATVLAVIGFMLSANSAYAWNDRKQNSFFSFDRQSRYQTAAHHYARRYGHVSGICWVAARMGGPCGCEASRIAFGSPVRDLWPVANWLLRFPRTSPHVGAAAIWGRHHVEIVTAVNADGTVSTAGSVGFSHVPIGRLRFVDPHVSRHYAGTI